MSVVPTFCTVWITASLHANEPALRWLTWAPDHRR